jgi:hypothetical protein
MYYNNNNVSFNTEKDKNKGTFHVLTEELAPFFYFYDSYV